MARVVHVTPTYFSDASVVGGGERYVFNLVRAIAPTGLEQSVVALGRRDEETQHEGVPLRVLRDESGLNDAMAGWSGHLADVIRGADLVHLHQMLTPFGAFATAQLVSAGMPVVGTDLGGGADALMLQRGGLGLLDGVVSISRFAHSLVAGAFDGPAAVLVGPVDSDAFTPDPAIARDPRLVLCVGRILPHKGVDRIIRALPPGLRLVIAGRVYHEAYAALLRELAAGKDVTFLHDADDATLLGLYRQAGVLVQASTARDVYGNRIDKAELMGLTTLEAMSCGLPAIVADTGSLPELVPDPGFGRVFRDDAALSAILEEVAAGHWPLAGAAQDARIHVVARHGMAATGAAAAAFYRDVIAMRSSRCAS